MKIHETTSNHVEDPHAHCHAHPDRTRARDPNLARRGRRPARLRSPLALRRAVLARGFGPVDGLVVAPGGRRSRGPPGRLHPPAGRHRPRTRPRRRRRLVALRPCAAPMLPVRHGPSRRAGRARRPPPPPAPRPPPPPAPPGIGPGRRHAAWEASNRGDTHDRADAPSGPPASSPCPCSSWARTPKPPSTSCSAGASTRSSPAPPPPGPSTAATTHPPPPDLPLPGATGVRWYAAGGALGAKSMPGAAS